jgi:hypothetical protein
MDGLVKECKSFNPGCFILAKVDKEKLTVTARARSDYGWEDLDRSVPIPLDILDPAELAAVIEEEVVEMVTLS